MMAPLTLSPIIDYDNYDQSVTPTTSTTEMVIKISSSTGFTFPIPMFVWYTVLLGTILVILGNWVKLLIKNFGQNFDQKLWSKFWSKLWSKLQATDPEKKVKPQKSNHFNSDF